MAWKATRTRFVTFCIQKDYGELLAPSVLMILLGILTFLCDQLYGSASVMSGMGLRSSVPCVFKRYWRCSSESALISSCSMFRFVSFVCRIGSLYNFARHGTDRVFILNIFRLVGLLHLRRRRGPLLFLYGVAHFSLDFLGDCCRDEKGGSIKTEAHKEAAATLENIRKDTLYVWVQRRELSVTFLMSAEMSAEVCPGSQHSTVRV